MSITNAITMKMIMLRDSLFGMTRLTGAGGIGRRGGLRGRRVLIGGEPYQRAFHIVKETGPGACRRAAPGDEHIVGSGTARLRQEQPRGLPQPAARADRKST